MGLKLEATALERYREERHHEQYFRVGYLNGEEVPRTFCLEYL